MAKQLIEMRHLNPAHDDMTLVVWSLGNACNFSCSYCDRVLNSGSVEWIETGAVCAFCDRIVDYYRNELGRRVVFQFTGGEVSLNRDLPVILDHVRAKGAAAGIISNGSRTLQFWEKLLPRLDHVMLSYHPEYDYRDHFRGLVAIVNARMPAYLNVMMLPERFDECREFGLGLIRDFPGNAVFFQALMNNIYDNHDLVAYRPGQVEELKRLYRYVNTEVNPPVDIMFRSLMRNVFDDGSSVAGCAGEHLVHRTHHWQGWICWAGVDGIAVSSSGDVFRAWCTQDWIGHISREPIAWPRYPVFCTRPRCHCDTDIRVRRMKFQPL